MSLEEYFGDWLKVIDKNELYSAINKINFFTAKQCENDFFGLAHDIEEPFTL